MLHSDEAVLLYMAPALCMRAVVVFSSYNNINNNKKIYLINLKIY
jgi:hypothetical protein